MDRYLLIEIGSDGLAFETAQLDIYLSWLGIILLGLSVVGYRIIKKMRKDK